MNFKKIIGKIRLKVRRKTNPILGSFRRRRLNNTDFTIISNNCWGGIIYEYFNLPKNSPTVGMYFFAEEYIRFIYNLKYYLKQPLEIINSSQSKYKEQLIERNQANCLIGKIADVEMVLLHFSSAQEAQEKWKRRCERVNYDNLIYKFSEMNYCTEEHIKAFDAFSAKKKVMFVCKDYGLKSQIVCSEWAKYGEVKNDTTNFNKHINLLKLINS
jgi:uncharacterized protein (DUF1919 family)